MKGLNRIRLIAVVFLSMASILACNSAFAKPENDAQYVGLWEGVDSLDGSTIRVSIGNLEGDKALEFQWYESFFTGCFDAGFAQGRGIIDGVVNRRSGNVIELEVTSYLCFDDDNNAVDLPLFTVDLEHAPKSSTLTSASTPEFPGFILHRTSGK